MSDSGSHPQNEAPSIAALSAQLQSLRLLLNGGLTAVLVASIGINVLLFKQMKALKTTNAELIPQFESAAQLFNEGEAKRIETLINQLKVFAKTNPDYEEVLKKFGLSQSAPAQAPPPAAK